MKTFLEHLKEEVIPTALVKDGSIDIAKPEVREEINMLLAGMTMHGCVTPYAALHKVQKALANFHIFLPKKTYMEGCHGVEVFDVSQFGNKMGMNDQGEFINEVPVKFYLFFRYNSFGGFFSTFAKLVDKKELDTLLDDTEKMVAEDAQMQQMRSKAIAPKEDAHTALGDCDCSQGDSPSTKSAVKVMMRGKKELDEAKKVKIKLNPEKEVGYTVHDVGPGGKKTLVKSGKTKVKDIKEDEQIDEISGDKLKRYYTKATNDATKKWHDSALRTDPEGKKLRTKSFQRMQSVAKADVAINKKDPKWFGPYHKSDEKFANSPKIKMNEVSHALALRAMKKSEKRGSDEYEADMTYDRLSDPDTHYDRADRLRTHMRKRFGNDKPGRGNVGRDALGDRTMSDRLKHGKRAGMPSREHITRLKSDIKLNKALGRNKKVNLPEEQIDEISQKLAGRYRSMADIDLQHAKRRGDEKTVEKRTKGIERASKHFKEETINEIGDTPKGDKVLRDYQDKARKQVSAINSPVSQHKMNKRIEGHKRAGDRERMHRERRYKENMMKEACWKGYEMVGMKKKGKRQVPNCVPVNEKITSKTSVKNVIHDFVHSDDKKFSGDSKKQRIKRALGAYNSMHKE